MLAGALGFPQTGVLGTVDHVIACDFVLAGAHQGQFDLILNVFDMNSATGGHASEENDGDLLGEPDDRLMYA